ncbi:MAG: YkgJ family cysteine cluster protein, partial [Armatimonadetes bacterium]|nr:YkgJ family cysteine cluster protein [Armatimonadota bacterium]
MPTPNNPPEDTSPEIVTAHIEFSVAGKRMQAEIGVPAGPTHPTELLPLFRSLADLVVNAGEEAANAGGERTSCRKGCGACCRQLVPISETEARRIRDLVEELPEPRRSRIRERFAQARRRLEESGFLDQLLAPQSFAPEDVNPFGMEYFRLGIPCPFLEEESCSIHPERPLACREYLVTSPAEHCADPTAEKIRRIPIPGKASIA